jgi:hypothetical protein
MKYLFSGAARWLFCLVPVAALRLLRRLAVEPILIAVVAALRLLFL